VIWVLFSLSALIPALVASKSMGGAITVLCVIQATYLSGVEYVLFTEKRPGTKILTSMYPAYFILLTSIAGLYVFYKFAKIHKINLNEY